MVGEVRKMASIVGLALLGAFLAPMAVSAQRASASTNQSARMLVFPRPRIPLSFEQVEERSRILADGSSAVETVISGRTFRDSAGRVRLDSETRDGSGRLITSGGTIMDPTNGSCVILV